MILVSLTGDFDSNVLPLFFHHSEELRIHILLGDRKREERERTANIEAGAKRFCGHYGIDLLHLQMHFDEDDKESIEETFARIEKLLQPGERLLLNGSDVLASTVAVLQPLLFAKNGSLVAYDRHENSCNVLTKERMYSEAVSPMTISEHLMLKNIAFEQTVDPQALLQRKESVLQLMQDTEHFNAFKTAFVQNRPTDAYAEIIKILRTIGKDEDKGYIQRALFEEYCYWLVHDLGFDDVQLGTLVTYNAQSEQPFQNELDLLCIKENHLHIIECKFRNFVDGDAIVYKYDAVIDLLDSDGRVMIVAVGGRNVQSNGRSRRVQFKEATKYRAAENNIAIYQEEVMDPERFRETVKGFLLADSQ